MPTIPTLNGYTFKGWNMERDGSGDDFTGTSKVESDIIVYAQWEPITYTVTFDTDGGSVAEGKDIITRTVTVPETMVGEENMPANPTRDGYTFKGWNTERDGKGDDFTGTSTVESDIIVYAQWEELKEDEKPPSDPPGAPPGDPPVDPPVDLPEEPSKKTFIDDHIAYIIGYPEGDVRPNRNITRAEVATVFFRLLIDEVRSNYWTQQNSFQDVIPGNWYNNAVSVKANMGVINGYPDGTFKPDGAITRAELAAIAARFAKQMEMAPSNDVSFSDISGHWAESDIRYAAALGWVNGYPDGTFKPNQPITRAEFMTLVNRMLERVPEAADDLLQDEMKHWIDNANPDAWYYSAVQEATHSHEADYKEDTVPGLQFNYEFWTEMIPNRDWAQLEREWSNAN
jgi:uncharacterized repeat protein (TIGR02543 family)